MNSAGPGLFPELTRNSPNGFKTGILPSQMLEEMIAAGHISSVVPVLPDQIQPSSLDLRLGPVAYRVRASFLPGDQSTVAAKLAGHKLHELDLTRPAVLEKGCVYIVPLREELSLPSQISGKVNPKSSTGRLDIFTRVITDYGRQFEFVPPGYKGKLYAEVVPRTFSVLVRAGARLSQLRLTRGAPQFSDADLTRLDEREMLVYDEGELPVEALIAGGLRLSVDLQGVGGSDIIGYRAKKHSSLIDLDCIGHYEPGEFWDTIYRTKNRDLVLDPEDFYILASKEKIRIPPGYAAEMVPYDPSVGEFRIHYAGFFDPGFGYGTDDIKGTRAVLEVRSHEVPFLLEDGQEVGSLTFERLMAVPSRLYGQGIGSNYQRQGLALSKHFKR
ncbi:MAG: 2'-deoxycytidine 5'-triphosphate deaminase [Acidobacteriota bacterium]|nr:2'-deoxycytidine 5'-triphosphate deaminase [Acidobacteriota bacterium]